MLNDFRCGCPVYLACGYTDLRHGFDGLAGLVQTQFRLDPFQNALFLFCGRRKDRIKELYWEGDGFVLLYKRLERGSFQWPRNGEEARQLTPQQYRWLMEQLRLLRKKQFGTSSEQSKEQLDGQLSLLFNEAEAYAAPPGAQKATQVAAHIRKPSGSGTDVAPANIPVEVVERRADETTLQVLHEPGKKAQTKSYMWLCRTGRDGEPPIVLYEYQPSRKTEHAAKFLEGISTQTAIRGYHKLPGIQPRAQRSGSRLERGSKGAGVVFVASGNEAERTLQ